MSSEAAIVRSILKYLNSLPNTYARKVHGSVYNAGFLDIICCHKGRCIWIEVKTPTGKVSDLQQREMDRWFFAGASTIIARSLTDVKERIL